MNYERLLTYGNVCALKLECDISKLLREIEPFQFRQYNSSKPQNPRFGLSITSMDGEVNGEDLDSIGELAERYQRHISELEFTQYTDVFYRSSEIQKLLRPFDGYLGRTHLLQLKNGGYFPPHRDDRGYISQEAVRIIVPLCECNPPMFYFIVDGKIQHFIQGNAYFMNTNLEHCLFSYSDHNLFLVANIRSCPEMHETIVKNLLRV